MSITHNTSGRPYAKLSELKELDTVEVDGDFDCFNAGDQRKVFRNSDDGQLFICCAEGQHFLRGQADDGDTLIGVHKVG